MKTPQETARAADARGKSIMAAAMAAASRNLAGLEPSEEKKSAADALAQDIEPAQEPPEGG